MSDCNKFELSLDILTPIHIGSGDILASSEYIIDTAKLRKKNNITEETVVRKINTIDLYNSFKTKTEKNLFVNSLKNLKFSLNNPEFNSKTQNPNFEDKFSKKNLKKYSEEIFKTNWDTEPDAKKDIECAIRTNNKLYIPGSSIKGAIKSALFYNLIETEEIPQIINDVSKEKFNQPIDKVFSAIDYDNPAQESIMRFLQISDSKFINSIPIIYEVMPYTLSKKNRNNRKPYKESKFAKLYLECIPQDIKLSANLNFTFNKRIYDKFEFSEKTLKCLDIEFIKESLFNFADDLIDFEVSFCKKNGLNDLAISFNDLKDYNYKERPLLLLGAPSGFHSKSIYLKIKKYDDNYNTNYLKDLEKYLEFKFPRGDFPKTRRCTKVDSKPLGWVQLDFKPLK